MEYLKLCAAKDVPPGQMRHFDVRGREVLVVNLNGQFFCLDARCTHAGAPLDEGTLEGDLLTCPWHYSSFRVTDGSVVNGPAQKPLGTYNIVVGDEQLFVEAREYQRRPAGS